MRLRTLFFFTLIALTSLQVLAQQPTPPADDTAIRGLVEDYFTTYEKRDIEGFMRLWTGLETDRARRREVMERRFKLEQSSFTPRQITRLDFRFSSGEVCVKTERTTKALADGATRTTPMHICWTLAKEDAWRIAREQPAVAAFAARFQSASEEERVKMLNSESEFLSPELAQILAGNSERWMASQQYAAALQSHVALRQVLTKLNDQPALADTWHESGVALQALGRYPESIRALAEALKLNEQLSRAKPRAETLSNIAATHHLAKQYELALSRYDETLKAYQALGNEAQIHETFTAIANVYYDRGDYDRAIKGYRDLLTLMASKLKVIPVSLALTNRRLRLAQIEYESGDNAAAEASFLQTLADYEKLQFRKSHGFICHSLGNLFYGQGDYAQAVRYYQLSLAQAQSNQDENAAASANQGIGLAQAFNGNYPAAVAAFEQQLAYWQKQKHTGQIAAALQRIASTKFSMNLLNEALPLYEQVERLRAQLGNPAEYGAALLDLGITLAGLGLYDEALQRYKQSLEQFTIVKYNAGIANVLVNTASVHFAQENYPQALAEADEAIQLARPANADEVLWQALYRKGKCQMRLLQLEAARQSLNEAITLVESTRSTPISGLLLTVADARLRPHLAQLDVLIQLKQGNEAFQLAERIKTRELFHILRNGRLWVTHLMSDAEREREAQLMKSIALLAAQIARENEKQNPSEQRLTTLRQQRRQAETAYDTFLRTLYQAHPRLATLRAESNPLTTEKAAALVPDMRTALLSYIESDETVYLFALSKSLANKPAALRIYQLDTNRQELDAALKENASQLPRTLHDWLLSLAQPQLAGKTQLLISPSRLMWNVNFEALPDANNQTLSQQAFVRYVPSFTAWQTVRNQPPAASVRNVTPLTVLAAPQFSDDTRARWQSATGQALAEQAAPNWTSSLRNAQTGASARLSQLGDSAQVHLAAPFYRNDYSPLYSAFALSAAPQESGWVELRALPYQKTARQSLSFTDANVGLHEGRAWLAAYWSAFLSGAKTMLLLSDEAASAIYDPAKRESFALRWRALKQAEKTDSAVMRNVRWFGNALR